MHEISHPRPRLLPLFGLLVLVLVWVAGMVSCFAYGDVGDVGGRLVLAGLVFCFGYGLVQEGRRSL